MKKFFLLSVMLLSALSAAAQVYLSRNYEPIAEHVVRFAPVIYGPEQMKGMHGMNENIEINCLPGAVDFYRNLIEANRNAEGEAPEAK